MDIYFLSVIIFLGILFVLVYKDRKNIEFRYLLLMRRTKTGIKILDKIARVKKFWKIVGTIGIFVAFFLMYEGIYSLILYGQLLMSGIAKIPGLSLILPSIKSEVESGPGYIFIPFWFWLIIIFSVMVPHEMFHGIICRAERIKIKSAGLLLLLVLPGAFVEPDERGLKRSKLMSKLRVFVSGSLANFLVYIFVFYLTSFVIWPYLVPGPIVLQSVNETGPAAEAGLKAGMVISEINGRPIKITYSEFLGGGYLIEETRGLKPGDEISIIVNNSVFKVRLGENPENKTLPYLGIIYSPIARMDNIKINFIIQLLTWVWIINYAVAVFNILPIYPLDGGMVVQAIVEKISKKHGKKITFFITFLVIFLLLFNFLIPFLLPLLPQFS